MSIEYPTNHVSTDVLALEQHIETILENNIIVPDSKPDIGDIIVADANILVAEANRQNDVVIVKGIVKYNILYLSEEDNMIHSMDNQCDFVQEVDCPGSRNANTVWADVMLERLDYELINGRKVGMKCIVAVGMNVSAQKEYDIACIDNRQNNMQTKQGKCKILTLTGIYEDAFTVEEHIELPPDKPFIKEILRSDISLHSPECTASSGMAYLNAIADIGVMYAAEDVTDSIQYIKGTIKISKDIRMDGISIEDICRVHMNLMDWEIVPAEDADGEYTILKMKMVINASIKVLCEKDVNYTEDMYSPERQINVNRETISFENISERKNIAVKIKENVMIDNTEDAPEEICNVMLSPLLSNTANNGDNLTLEGYVDCKILYFSNNPVKKVNMVKTEIPYSVNVPMENIQDNNVRSNIELKVKDAFWEIAGDNEINLNMELAAEVLELKTEEKEVVTGVQETDLPPVKSNSPITLYFTNEKDTLWDIAKKYGTTMDKVSELNGIPTETPLKKGQKLLIVR